MAAEVFTWHDAASALGTVLTLAVSAATALWAVKMTNDANERRAIREREDEQREQRLREFYGPLHGLCVELHAKLYYYKPLWKRSALVLREERRERDGLGRIRQHPSPQFASLEGTREAFVEKLEEVVDLYTQKNWLAEPCDLEIFAKLIAFTEQCRLEQADFVDNDADCLFRLPEVIDPLVAEVLRQHTALTKSLTTTSQYKELEKQLELRSAEKPTGGVPGAMVKSK